jgi:hypothetical protein
MCFATLADAVFNWAAEHATVLSTAVSAFGTVVVAIFTVALFHVGGRQLRELKRSVDILAQSERAVLHTVVDKDNFRDLMKGSILYDNSPGMADGAISTKGTVTYRIKNYGKTPAVIKEISHFLTCDTALPSDATYTPSDIIQRSPMLSAGNATEEIVCQFGNLLKKRDTDEVLRGQKSIWFYGRVIYDDIFGVEHEHRFVWRYHGGTKGFRPDYQETIYNKNS